MKSQYETPIYEQKINFLEMQLYEYKTREENLKKMNDSIMEAISDTKNQAHTRVK